MQKIYMLGVHQWRHLAYVMEHFVFPGNIDFAADDQRIAMYYSWKADAFIHLWNNVYNRWITSNFPEAATKYYNYTAKGADEERTPTADASKSDGEIRQHLQFKE